MHSVRSFMMLGMCLAVLTGGASAQAQHRPISEYLDAIPNFWTSGWVSPETGQVLRIDAYGKMNSLHNLNAGTSIKGKVSIQSAGEGMQKVTIHLHARNAVCWGYDQATNAMLFGYSPLEPNGVNLLRASPATGDAMLLFESYPVPTSSPIDYPNLVFSSVNATIMCNGVLRASSGYAEGTEGFAQTTQVGRFDLGTPSGCAGNQGNCYTAEKVQFKPTGN